MRGNLVAHTHHNAGDLRRHFKSELVDIFEAFYKR
jgi:hypothetical protein